MIAFRTLLLLCASMLPVRSLTNSSSAPWEDYVRDQSVPLGQASALYDFFVGTSMANSSLLPWFSPRSNATSYCDFPGVKCDRDDYVVVLDAAGAGLTGTIPGSVGDLERLTIVRLQENSLRGEVPSSFGRLTELVHLNLRDNTFSSTIPDLSALTSLRRLLIDRNALSGSIPPTLCSLTSLVVLDLSANTRMFGYLPSCLSNLNDLTVLKVTNLGLVGEVPSSLCENRPMNGLANNSFGCDAIACAAGTFRQGNGRQVSEETPCLSCGRVPSNVLGSSVCNWVEVGAVGEQNESNPSAAPNSLVPSSFPNQQEPSAPSAVPTFSPVGQTKLTAAPVPPDRESGPAAGIEAGKESEGDSRKKLVGYIIIGTLFTGALVVLILFVLWCRKKVKNKRHETTLSMVPVGQIMEPDRGDLESLSARHYQTRSLLMIGGPGEATEVVGAATPGEIPSSTTDLAPWMIQAKRHTDTHQALVAVKGNDDGSSSAQASATSRTPMLQQADSIAHSGAPQGLGPSPTQLLQTKRRKIDSSDPYYYGLLPNELERKPSGFATPQNSRSGVSEPTQEDTEQRSTQPPVHPGGSEQNHTHATGMASQTRQLQYSAGLLQGLLGAASEEDSIRAIAVGDSSAVQL